MELLLELFSTVSLDRAVEIFASISLYSFPLLFFFNGKIITRKLDLKKGTHDDMNDTLRRMYIRKTLYFLLMLVLYIANIILADTQSMTMLVYPIMLTYFGLSFALISIEIKSILTSYKEVKSALYTPVLKRWSFWVLMGSSAFKLWQFSGASNHMEPSQIIAILDMMSYGFIFISVFVFVYFDKKKNITERALRKSRKIVISMKDDVARSERYRTKRNREITKVLGLLRLCMGLIGDERKIRDIERNIKELELLLITS